ncbi:MAG: tyrosine-type recombinase/integrase [Dehalococcoidia bacterium]|nr:tyrosine-type recombinase/integrase [Dehalococcoidia bacterium]
MKNSHQTKIIALPFRSVKPVGSLNITRIADFIRDGRVRFHDLRHTFASLALLRGAKPKVISEALGHASVAFTMDTYSHIISGMQEDMMALLDEVLPTGFIVKSPIKQS